MYGMYVWYGYSKGGVWRAARHGWDRGRTGRGNQKNPRGQVPRRRTEKGRLTVTMGRGWPDLTFEEPLVEALHGNKFSWVDPADR